MYRSFLLFILVLSIAVTGCAKSQTMKDSWKFTTKQYRNYLNTPAALDMEATGDCENYELALGDAVLKLDSELQKFIRAMENSDHSPDQAWVMSMMGQFPWLSGVALIDASGTVVAKYPETLMKEFDAKPLLAPDPKQRISALRAYVQKTPLGPEVYLANPVFGGEEMRGMVVAFFDPRTLAAESPEPGSFMMASPVGVIWEGSFGAGGPVGREDWDSLLKRKACGLIGDSGSQFYWTTRYLGNLPLVYAVPASAGKAPAPAAASAERPAEAPKKKPAAEEN